MQNEQENYQYSLDWYRQRLGRFNGSEVYALMGTPRTKGETLTATAKTYCQKVASERILLPKVFGDDDLLQSYIATIETNSRATNWGHLQEPSARVAYELTTGRTTEHVGSCEYTKDTELTLSASPDGLVADNGNRGALEIKCPYTIAKTLELALVQSFDDLAKVAPQYYWQIVAECLCTDSEFCDFVVYDIRLDLVKITRMTPTADDKAKLLEKVALGQNYVNELLLAYDSAKK